MSERTTQSSQVGASSAAERVFACGAELFVLAGELLAGDHSYVPGSWIRLPAGERSEIAAGVQGVTFYLKTGHLAGRATKS